MAISDYIKKYFEPSPKLRGRDIVREIPGATLETGKKILGGFQKSGQSFFRGTAGVASTLTGKTLTPSTYFQKELYGTDKPITSRSFGAELGFNEKGKIAPIAGFAIAAADLIPGGSVSKKGAVTLLKNANKADDALRILTKVMGVAVEVAQKYVDDAVRLTDEKKLLKLVDSVVIESQEVSRFLNKGKQAVEKMRGFVKSAKEVLPDANKIAGQYIPRSTDDLILRAKKQIAENVGEAERIALGGSDENAVAVASELLKKYADDAAKSVDPAITNALYDKAAEVANTLAPKLTEQGRAIQAASILGRLTPEGQVRFAARHVQKYNETARVKIPEITGQQVKSITDQMKKIASLPDGLEKATNFQKLQNEIQDLVPTPLIKKVTAIWKAGLLTGVKTSGLNLFSNLSHSTTEVLKDAPAAIVDNVASLFTGQRTKTFTLRGQAGGLQEGFEKGIRYFKTGFDERNLAQKLDYKKVNFGKGAVAKVFQTYTDIVFRALGTADQPFYYGALSRSLMDQALAQGKNAGKSGQALISFAEELVKSPTEEMLKYGVADAATAVFQNETYLGKAAKAFQKVPVVGEIVVPFGRTPSAVATQIINYTPIGIASQVIKMIGKGQFDQRLFSEAVGRGLTGIGVLAIGGELFKKGLVALDRPTTEREQKQWELEGKKPNSVKIGDKWRSPTVLGPAGNLLLIGGHFQKSYTESGSPTEALAKVMTGSAKSFSEQTFLTGVNQAVAAITDPARSAESYFETLVSSVVPTLASDVARANDPLERRAETIPQRIMARIPGLRKKLEPQVDVLGKERARVGNPLEVLLDPTRPSPSLTSPVIRELRTLTDRGLEVSPTLLGDKKGFTALTQKQNTELWKYAGEIINDKLESLFSRESYKNLEDDEKEKIVEKVIDQSKINARAAVVLEITEDMTGEELKNKLSELKKGGLLTRDVFLKYQELR